MKRLRQRVEYALVLLTLWVTRLLPWRLVRGMGSALGFLFFTFDRRHRRIALANVAAAFPRKAPAEREALVRQVFGHFGRVLFELLKFSGLSRKQMTRMVEFVGDERIREAHAQGKGALLFTGHFGYWEINAIAQGAMLYPIGVLARPLDNPWLHDLLERMRGCTGNSVIYRRGALRRVLKALAANQAVAMLIDQHIQAPDAVTVSFFDRPASTTLALAMLAVRTGAPVIPVFAVPLRDGRYRLVYEHPVDPPSDDSPEAIRDFTQRCTDVLEMQVRRHPELWLWMHRRWRDDETAESGEPGMFPSAARENGPPEP
ncbi:MAG: lysophospholipid acyltransferase family protein [Acidobacteria bacterium]|nr:lysophospholipid acyltransferase family protein [Acidobacteriota bacterium]